MRVVGNGIIRIAKTRKAFTLIELIVVLALLGIVIAVGSSLLLFGNRTFKMSQEKSANQYNVRMPMDFISKEVRFANNVEILTSLPTASLGAYDIYVETGHLKYNKNGSSAMVPGTSGIVYDTFTVKKISSNTIEYRIGKSGYNEATQVSILNIGTTGITGFATGIGLRFSLGPVINSVPVTGIVVNPPTLSLGKGALYSKSLNVTTVPNDANVTWTTSNDSIASVSNGVVTGINIGTADITAALDDGTSSVCTVTVRAPVLVTGVSLPTSLIVFAGEPAVPLIATISPGNADNMAVTWKSSNGNASVSASGEVTGVSAGSSTVTVTTVDGLKTDTCSVTVIVPIPVTGVTLDRATLSIVLGGQQTLNETILPSGAHNKAVVWSTSNSSVASVSDVGVVASLQVGTAVIAVTTVDGGKTANCTVTVTPVLVTGIAIVPTTMAINVGATGSLTPTVLPVDATDQTVVWSSSNTAVATVANGVVTAVSRGTATITATTVDGGKSATCTVTVKVPVTGVSLNKTLITISKKSSQTLTATINPIDATDQTVTWTSSDTTIATVDNSGVVTAKNKTGSTNITVRTNDGSFTAVCIVSVP